MPNRQSATSSSSTANTSRSTATTCQRSLAGGGGRKQRPQGCSRQRVITSNRRTRTVNVCAISLDGEIRNQFFRHRHVLQLHIIRQAILKWRIGFAEYQRRQIAAGRVSDAKAVGADEIGRQQLLLVGDLGERCGDDVPAVGYIAEPADPRHHRVLSGDREFYRRATDR